MTLNQTDCVEITLGLNDGSRVAVKCWGDEKAQCKILCLHGWLDNASTWDNLVPLLIKHSKQPLRLVAIDFLGHGNSSHKSSYLAAQRAIEVANVADALNWSTFILMGHSMGAAVSSVVAGALPNRIEKLICIEGLGPWNPPLGAPEQLELAIKQRPQLLRRQRKVYPSLEAAVDRYVKNNHNRIKQSSARILVERATEEVLVQATQAGDDQTEQEMISEKGFCFKHDPKLVGMSSMSYSEQAVHSFLKRISCPTLLILASNDEFLKNSPENATRAGKVIQERIPLVKNLTKIIVKGEHHVHLDAPELLYQAILDHISPKSKL